MTHTYKLSDVFDLQMGKTPSRDIKEYWQDGEYEWISIADLTKSGKYICETKEKISQLAVEESGIRRIPSNTVIMSFKLSIGKVAITKKSIFSNEAIMAFIDKGVVSILPQYAYYLFSAQTWDKGVNRAVMGTTLNKATLSQYRISLHDKEIQLEIVEKLDKISELIAARKEQLCKVDDLVKSQFIEMFGDVVKNDKSWNCLPMTTVAPVSAYKGNIESTEGKYWLLNLDMVEAQTGDIISQVMVELNEVGASTVAFNQENVLYSKLRPYLNKVVNPKIAGYATSELVPLKPNKKYLNKVFFTALLRSDAFVHYIRSRLQAQKCREFQWAFLGNLM